MATSRKPTHWTYQQVDPRNSDLFQGDIISRTDALDEVIGAVHPHFSDPKYYIAFVLITQTCDLVVRGGECKTKHISLAVIRALDDLVLELLQELCGTTYNKVFDLGSRFQAKQLLEKILNQNEQAQGMFYFHPDADVGIAVPSVALPRVSIAFRAQHYAMLKEARSGRLSTEFRNKLGWLTGNLYSRVDTPDWSDSEGGKERAERIVEDLLDREGENVWVPSSWIAVARQKRLDLNALSSDDVRRTLHEHAPKPPLEVVTGRVQALSGQLAVQFADKQFDALLDRVSSDRAYHHLAVDQACSVACSVFGSEDPAGLIQLRERSSRDEGVRVAIGNAFRDIVAAFRKIRGPRDLSALVSTFSGLPLLDDAAVRSFGEIASMVLGERYSGREAELTGLLRAERPAVPVIDHFQCLAESVLNQAMSERLVTKLVNDQAFKAALKSVS